MEKFTNSRGKYWNQIKTELLNERKSEQILFRYLEIGQLLSHGYSITQITTEPNRLLIREWDAVYDNKRFDKGVYNLDRLAISDYQINLSLAEQTKIRNLLNLNFELTNWDGIVLDGLFCQLETNKLKFDWNCNEEINETTKRFVDLLRNKVN